MNGFKTSFAGPIDIDVPVAVIGAGAMGTGIAQVAATAGHSVYLFDSRDGAAVDAVSRIAATLEKRVAQGRLDVNEAAATSARVIAAEKLDDIAAAGLVIEAIIEDLDSKSSLFSALENILDDDAIITSNTSSLSITQLAKGLSRPGQFAGFHFFNPAPVLPLVEVVKGAATDPSVIDCLVATASSWNKTPVACGSTPGFIVNRVARPFYGEAMRVLEQKCADVASIDALITGSGGFRMGPFALTDLIGQDVNYAVTESVWRAFYFDPRYQPSLVQQELVFAGHLGKKTGCGFYSYGSDAEPISVKYADSESPPSDLTVVGDLGPAASLEKLAVDAGMDVSRESGKGFIRLGGLMLALSDGASANERSLRDGPLAFFDLALDYGSASCIGLCFSDQVSDDHRSLAIGFFQALGKDVIVVDDIAGMVVARTVAMLVNEALDAKYLGVASGRDIEIAMTKGVNYPVGLLKWGAELGFGYVLEVISNLNAVYPDGRYRVSPLLRRLAITNLQSQHLIEGNKL